MGNMRIVDTPVSKVSQMLIGLDQKLIEDPLQVICFCWMELGVVEK